LYITLLYSAELITTVQFLCQMSQVG
jgi:hypothetical protein